MILYAHKSYYIWHSFCRLNSKFWATTFFPGTAKFSGDWSVVENSVWEKKNLNTSSGRGQYIKSGFSLYMHWLVLSVAFSCSVSTLEVERSNLLGHRFLSLNSRWGFCLWLNEFSLIVLNVNRHWWNDVWRTILLTGPVFEPHVCHLFSLYLRALCALNKLWGSSL